MTTYLSIGELSSRTGVTPSTLRIWEERHGFPVPTRLESGHRRYAEGEETLHEDTPAGTFAKGEETLKPGHLTVGPAHWPALVG